MNSFILAFFFFFSKSLPYFLCYKRQLCPLLLKVLVLWRGHIVPMAWCFREYLWYMLHVFCCCVVAALSLGSVVCRGPPWLKCEMFAPGLAWASFNYLFLVCLWSKTGHQLHQNWGSGELWLGDVVWAEICIGLLWKGPTILGLRQTWLRSLVLPEHREVGLRVSKSGSQWLCWATSLRRFLFMLINKII